MVLCLVNYGNQCCLIFSPFANPFSLHFNFSQPKIIFDVLLWQKRSWRRATEKFERMLLCRWKWSEEKSISIIWVNLKKWLRKVFLLFLIEYFNKQPKGVEDVVNKLKFLHVRKWKVSRSEKESSSAICMKMTDKVILKGNIPPSQCTWSSFAFSKISIFFL